MHAPLTQAAPKAEPEPEEIVPTSENVLVDASIIREEVTEKFHFGERRNCQTGRYSATAQ